MDTQGCAAPSEGPKKTCQETAPELQLAGGGPCAKKEQQPRAAKRQAPDADAGADRAPAPPKPKQARRAAPKKAAVPSARVASAEAGADGTSAPPKPKQAGRAAPKKAAAPSAQEPFGANFVRQDLKKGKRRGASAGVNSAAAKQFEKYRGKNGHLKSKYTQLGYGKDANGILKGSFKNQRIQHFKQQALADRSLVNVRAGAADATAFSSSVTADMIVAASTLRPDEVRSSRPADGAVRGSAAAAAEPLEAEAGTPPEAPGEVSFPDPERCSAEDLLSLLRGTFRHQDFRPGQREAVMSVLAGNNTLLVLSTGAGKSLCYQIPAYVLREQGLTLVISPLVSLMADQLSRLPGCLRGAILSGQQTREQARNVMSAVRARLVDVLFISPERLSMWSFDGCGLPPIALACIDEAHCVSEWSHNFRPDYLRLHEFLVGSIGAQRVLALTATATRPTVKSVCDILHLGTIVRCDRSFTLKELMEEPSQPRVQRSNLAMDVKCLANEDVQFRELAKLLQSTDGAGQSAVVYVWKRWTADELAKRLKTRIRGGVRAYHGQMVPEARRAVQDSFMAGLTRVVIATMAFGMGLDKPDIRMVVHYGIPKSIENYIQETGRCSRDGAAGRCVALVCPQDYKAMRWVESGGGGGGTSIGFVRRLMAMLFETDQPGPQKRYDLLEGAPDQAPSADAAHWKPYYVAFDEKDAARHLNCSADELHSVLAHFAFRSKAHASLFSSFPTKMKLRFFRTDPDELAKSDPLLRKVLPLAKKSGPVYTLETAKALAALGGKPGQLASALWQARGDEFSLEKAEYGFMVAVHKCASEAQIEAWADEISNINVRARQNSVEKLDAIYIALTRAGDAGASAAGGEDSAEASSGNPAAHQLLSGMIDQYFAAMVDPSVVVAGDTAVRKRVIAGALGSVNSVAPPPSQADAPPRAASADAGSSEADAEREQLRADAVYSVVARLVMSPDWPDLPAEDPAAAAHAAAQFLAGIGSVILPAKQWRSHRCWGRFRGLGDFETLKTLVGTALERLSAMKARPSSSNAAASLGA